MKNTCTQSYYAWVMALALFLSVPLMAYPQITSAPAGGNWNNPATWIGGNIPGPGDNVIIASTVNVEGSSQCNNITVQSNGVLQHWPANHYTLNVNGSLTNQGVIKNGNSYTLTIYVKGNVNNSGSMTNGALYLSGTGNQEIASVPLLQMGSLIRTAGPGRIIAQTDLSFQGTAITLNADTLEFGAGNKLSLIGGNVSNGVFYKSAMPGIQFTGGNGTYLTALNIDSPETSFYGELLINGSNNVFKNNIINNGKLRNTNYNLYNLTIAGNLTNNDTIQNGIYNFTIYISGNVSNNGTWQNYSTVLNGTGNQALSMTQPFSGTLFSRNMASGRVLATSNLSFKNTNIDFSYDTLEFTSGNSITMQGGRLSNITLFKTSLPAIQLFGSDNFLMENTAITAPQTEFGGSVLFLYGNNFKTHLINNAVMQNHTSNHYTLTIDGSITNNGTIKNNVYNLTVNVSGNLTNNGSWENYSTVLNGMGNQELSMSQAFTGSNLTKSASPGLVKATSAIGFVNTKINFNNDTLQFNSGTSISLTGGYFDKAVFFSNSPTPISLISDNAYLSYITADVPELHLEGILLIAVGNTFKNNVVNNAVVQNHSSNLYTLTIDGSITNNGTIKNGIYYLTVNVSGNVSNNGIWKNRTTTLTGTNNRNLSMTKRFEGAVLNKSVANGNIIATTDLTFDGTSVDLGGALLTLPDEGQLAILNGSFGDVIIGGNDIHFNTLAGYCFSTQFTTNVSLYGVFQAAGGVSFDANIINHGTFRNYGNNSYSVTVSGDLENNGSVSNSNYYFSLIILGDITNNGTWTNYQTTLDGAADQYVYLNNTISGRLLLDANNTGTGNWFGPSGSLVGNPNFSGATSQVLTFLNPVTSAYEGQYYRSGSSGNSRSIYINTPANPTRMVSMNFLLQGLYLSGGVMRASLDGNSNPVFGSNIADQVTISLHDNSNYSNVVFTRHGALLNVNGTVSFTVPGNFTGSYYLSVQHRSGVVTVSASPVSFSSQNVAYSFDQPSKAYGNNLAQTNDGYYALYGGDVNQDGVVDSSDMTPVDNEAADFAVGYRNPDTNGDGVIDTNDLTLIDNNSANFVSVITP
ncbi:MAG: dockerin type I repeat-containing protein [Lentimicrobiaceae bacterium]|nr:dockerin type I repeat-containing protein [Lentimicrobiaceae bacterium]